MNPETFVPDFMNGNVAENVPPDFMNGNVAENVPPNFSQKPEMFVTQNATSLKDAMSANEQYTPESVDLELAEACARFHYDPLGWARWAFDWGYGALEGFDDLDEWQILWLDWYGQQLRKNVFNGRDAVPPVRAVTASGHGIGKSALVSIVILFIMSTRPYAKGIVTANTGDQLRTKTWGELAKWKALCITGHWFELNSGKGSLSMHHKSWPETWRVDAQTCREENSEAFAGLHSATSTPFYIFDEASAVPDKIWEVAEGGLTDGEPLFAAFGNPTRNTGAFAEKFSSNLWHKFKIDSRTARMPNKKLIAEWIQEHGLDSDFVRVRVRGEFPRAGDMQFIPGDVAADARKRGPGRYLGDDPLICGVDIARGGDDNCVIQFRRGKDAKSESTYIIPGEKSRDSMIVVSKLIMTFDRHRPDYIFVDETGIGGPILDRLKQLGYNAVGVHFGGVASDEKKFKNKTAEMGYACRQWLIDGGCIPDNGQLEKELTSREYSHDDVDRLVLERKKDMKKRIGCSPDWADALYLTFAHPVPKLEYGRGVLDVAPHAREYVNGGGSGDYDPMDNL